MPQSNIDISRLTDFLEVEKSVRHALTRKALVTLIVDETKRLMTCRRAVLVLAGQGRKPRIEAVSDMVVPDRRSRFHRWMRRLARHWIRHEDPSQPAPVDPSHLPAVLARDWGEWATGPVLWCPLIGSENRKVGALCLFGERPWGDKELLLINLLTDAYTHAFLALVGPKLKTGKRRWRLIQWGVIALGLLLLLLFPVRQTALGPAEIVPHQPFVVTAPMDGIVSAFAVKPNQAITEGSLLFSIDETELGSQLEVAERSLDIALAEYRSAAQGAFLDKDSKGKLIALEAQIALRRAERDVAERRLKRAKVTAARTGIAVFADPQDWIGQPIKTGQRILELADPDDVEIRINLPAKAIMPIATGAPVKLFLDIDPLTPIEARIVMIAYEAERTAEGFLAYRLTARQEEAGRDQRLLRIGLQGTASVQGRVVPLYLYLFRRPIAFLRQSLGL